MQVSRVPWYTRQVGSPLPMTSTRSRIRDAGITSVAAGIFAALSYDIVHAFPYGLMYDDGYFYAQIAYNLGRLGTSTFDGVNTTSGFHLLWGAILGGVSATLQLVTPSKPVHLVFFQWLFAGLALGAARVSGRGLLAAVGVFVLVLMSTLLMETLLLSLLLLVFARLSTRAEALSRFERGAVLCVVFLVPLARIDASVILLIYATLLLFDGQRRDSRRVLTALGLGVMTQFALMYAFFGHVFSVSSLIKAGQVSSSGGAVWANLVGPEAFVLGYAVRSALFIGLLVPALVLCLAGRRDPATRKRLYLVAGAATFSAGHFVTHLMPFWCYLPSYLMSFHAIQHCNITVPSFTVVRRLALVGITILGVAFLGHKVRIHFANLETVEGARDFVVRIKDHVPDRERVYQIDGSGFTGYFSERSVMNGDGLVNSYDYASRLSENSLAGILGEQGVCYIITNTAPTSNEIVNFGGLVVSPDEVHEVLRTRTYGRYPTTDFVLYRRAVDSCPPTP